MSDNGRRNVGDVVNVDLRTAIMPVGITVGAPMTGDPVHDKGHCVVTIRGRRVNDDELAAATLLCSLTDVARLAHHFTDVVQTMLGELRVGVDTDDGIQTVSD